MGSYAEALQNRWSLSGSQLGSGEFESPQVPGLESSLGVVPRGGGRGPPLVSQGTQLPTLESGIPVRTWELGDP